MHRLFTWLALASVTTTGTGCATLLASGPSEVDVQVIGPDQGADVTIQGVQSDETIRKHEDHFRVTLDRNSSYAFFVVADGYEPQMARVRTVPEPTSYLDLIPELLGIVSAPYVTPPLGNTVFWGGTLVTVVALLFDGATKSAQRHDMKKLVIRLKKVGDEPAL